jgi:hypothetical protein
MRIPPLAIKAEQLLRRTPCDECGEGDAADDHALVIYRIEEPGDHRQVLVADGCCLRGHRIVARLPLHPTRR